LIKRVPRRERAAAPAPASPGVQGEVRVQGAAGAKRCLIVDDSRVIRKISRSIVERLGFEVMEAENGKEALARCKVSMPQLILLDWNMPVMTGIEFVSELRRSEGGPQPKVVFCTTKSSEPDLREAIGAGADEYVIKPFDEVTLRSKLERIGVT
jgi:two-component system chemotaxis response regulator CheY